MDSIKEFFASIDWGLLGENVNNDTILEYVTHPYGLGALGVFIVITILLKWRIIFCATTAMLLAGLVGRYTLTGPEAGVIGKTMLLFIAGAVGVGAFVIYFTFIRDD